ncbi:hypothetical protein BDV39DRAFT_201526 [Aspergillus sergii]|uniref:Carbohydrate kinase FGGY C-terminal domain-containing protein n=1 Tax=Aspergillus sergii TaxID=1034303 RepID=A0A5N6XCG7_9EURO|nr:hypothetical protein BDV39DRAFT_201526 [Aspergillus sergii]
MWDNELFVPSVWGPYYDVLFLGTYLAEGGQSATGEVIRHIVESHPAYSEAETAAKRTGVPIYDFWTTVFEGNPGRLRWHTWLYWPNTSISMATFGATGLLLQIHK